MPLTELLADREREEEAERLVGEVRGEGGEALDDEAGRVGPEPGVLGGVDLRCDMTKNRNKRVKKGRNSITSSQISG